MPGCWAAAIGNPDSGSEGGGWVFEAAVSSSLC